MSYANRYTSSINDAEYAKLKQQQIRVEEVAQDWIARATALHVATTASADKAELVALRDSFITSLTTILQG